MTRRVAGEETVTHKTFSGPGSIERAQKWVSKQEKKD